MKRLLILFLLFLLAYPLFAQIYIDNYSRWLGQYNAAKQKYEERSVSAEKNEFKKVEFGIFFGVGTPQFDFKNSFSDSYRDYWYDLSYWSGYYTEYDLVLAYSSSITGKAESKFVIGGFFNYFFSKNFGLQFMLDTPRYNISIEPSHSVDLSYYYYWGKSVSYSAHPSIERTTGSLRTMPISFNVITKFDIGANISGYASGGLTYYQVDIEAESKGGVGVEYLWYDYSYDLLFLARDSVLVPIYIDDSYRGTGGNIGGGFSFQIKENFGIVADFRLYVAPKKDVSWILRAGSYSKVLCEKYGWSFPLNTLNITQDEINDFLEKNGRFLQIKVDPSYYRFSLGLQFRF